MGDVQTQILTPQPPPLGRSNLFRGGGGHIWPKPGAQGAGIFFGGIWWG